MSVPKFHANLFAPVLSAVILPASAELMSIVISPVKFHAGYLPAPDVVPGVFVAPSREATVAPLPLNIAPSDVASGLSRIIL